LNCEDKSYVQGLSFRNCHFCFMLETSFFNKLLTICILC